MSFNEAVVKEVLALRALCGRGRALPASVEWLFAGAVGGFEVGADVFEGEPGGFEFSARV